MRYLAILFIGFALGCFVCALRKGAREAFPVVESDTVWVTKTVRKDSLVAKDSLVVRYRTVAVPCKDTLHHVDTLMLPVVQKHYEDSTMEAWVSGYEPMLDSIVFKEREMTVTKTIVRNAPRWSVGVQTGVGLGVNGVSPYVGVGIGYRLFGF